jgi:hypothetical protein
MPDNSENSQSTDPAEELKHILTEVEQKGEEGVDKARSLLGSFQYMRDFASAAKEVVPYIHPNDIPHITKEVKSYNNQADQLLIGLNSIPMGVVNAVNSSAGTVTVSVTGSVSGTTDNPFSVPETAPGAQEALDNLFLVTNRFTTAGQVEDLLEGLGFAKARKGRKSALHLFQTAHHAYQIPVMEGNPSSTSLIPMRECIHVVIAELIKRRPKQEEAKNEEGKILSIGRQLKNDFVPIDTFEALGRQWHSVILQKYLSTAKQQEISREEWSRRLQEATNFLYSLLTALDPQKMKFL